MVVERVVAEASERALVEREESMVGVKAGVGVEEVEEVVVNLEAGAVTEWARISGGSPGSLCQSRKGRRLSLDLHLHTERCRFLRPRFLQS